MSSEGKVLPPEILALREKVSQLREILAKQTVEINELRNVVEERDGRIQELEKELVYAGDRLKEAQDQKRDPLKEKKIREKIEGLVAKIDQLETGGALQGVPTN